MRLNYSCVYSTYFDFQPIQQHLARKHQINVRPLGKRLRDPDKQVVAFPLKLSEQNYCIISYSLSRNLFPSVESWSQKFFHAIYNKFCDGKSQEMRRIYPISGISVIPEISMFSRKNNILLINFILYI